MTNKEKKIGAVKFVAFILKEIINSKMPAGFIANILNEGLSEGSDYLSGQIEGNEIGNGSQIIDAILTDIRLKTLYVPEDYYDMVRSNVRDVLKIISINDELLRSCSYEEKKIARKVMEAYQNDHLDQFTQQEILYLEKGLNEIVSVLVRKLSKQPDVMARILGRTEDVLTAIEKQGEQQQYGYSQIQKSIEENQAVNSQIQKSINELKDLVERQSVMGETIHLRPDVSEMYANRWTERMFLHRDDGNIWKQNITLENTYQLPSYKNGKKDYFDLHKRLEQFVSETRCENRMLLVLGQPGSGKSTLITYLLNRCIANCDREILVYQFAKLKQVDWASDPKQALLNALRAEDVTDFSGKVLILDGFDEISVSGSRERILDQLYDDIAMDYSVEDFSLLITCREHYITGETECDRILLNPFTEQQIKEFCSTYWNQFGVKKEDSEKLKKQFCEKKEIMGIPLLLYMTLALDITIEKGTSYVDIYDKIFAIDGGIYDRCIAVLDKKGRIKKHFEASHLVAREIKQQLHRISKEIALYMLEYEPETASISQEAYQQIVERVQREELKIIERSIPISFYLKKIAKQIDGVDTEQLKFIHRSMYEYFVAVAVCDEIVDAKGKLIQQGNEREMINRLTPVLCRRQFSDDIKQHYLEYRISKHVFVTDQEGGDRCADWWRGVCDTILTEGIVLKEVPFWNCAEKQAIGFLNFIPLMRGIFAGCQQKEPYQIGSVERIMDNIKNTLTIKNKYNKTELIDLAFTYMKDARLDEVDLRKVGLRGTGLRGNDLRGNDLRGKDLREADLSIADLREADLRKADLRGANLRGADLRKADLRGANLRGTDLRGADLRGADLRGANLRNVKLERTNFIGANIKGADFTNTSLKGGIGLDVTYSGFPHSSPTQFLQPTEKELPMTFDLHNIPTFGIAGNFTGHLEQAGEARDFTNVQVAEANAPKAVFPTYLPGAEAAEGVPDFLGTFPFHESQIVFPEGVEKLQIEPECAIVLDVVWEDGQVVELKPLAFGASNDCSIRKEGVRKISQKKNWGACSKGFAEKRLSIDRFAKGGILDNYRIASFLVRDDQVHAYGEDSAVSDYSYMYEKLLAWTVDKLNHQQDAGPAEPIHAYLQAIGCPSRIMISIGATRYTEYGEHNFLQSGDEAVVVLYPGDRYTKEQIAELVAQGDVEREDVSVLRQTVVFA